MHPIKKVPPDAMSQAERCAEVAALLANGLCRLRAANAKAHTEGQPERRFSLGFRAQERVYTDPVN